MEINYIDSLYGADAFTCPFCCVCAKQRWGKITASVGKFNDTFDPRELAISFCDSCNKFTIWVQQDIVFPSLSIAPQPHRDMPEEVRNDFEEARKILSISPRGASALLRLCVQKLCIHLGEKGKNINKDIGSLVKKGLPVKIQKALDIVRVVGNSAVHPGNINYDDNTKDAKLLFNLINEIVNAMISVPKMISQSYEDLPPDKREEIKKRDKKQPAHFEKPT